MTLLARVDSAVRFLEHWDATLPDPDGTTVLLRDCRSEIERLKATVARLENNARVAIGEGIDTSDPVFTLGVRYRGVEADRDRLRLKAVELGNQVVEQAEQIERLETELAALQPDPEPDSYAGWTVVSVGDDGGVLLQSPAGARLRAWFQVAEIERLEVELASVREALGWTVDAEEQVERENARLEAKAAGRAATIRRLRNALAEMNRRFGHFAAMQRPTDTEGSPAVLLADLAAMVRAALDDARNETGGEHGSEPTSGQP